MFDVLAVVCVCGLGDLVGINNYTFTAIDLEVYAKSRATEALVKKAREPETEMIGTLVRSSPVPPLSTRTRRSASLGEVVSSASRRASGKVIQP